MKNTREKRQEEFETIVSGRAYGDLSSHLLSCAWKLLAMARDLRPSKVVETDYSCDY